MQKLLISTCILTLCATLSHAQPVSAIPIDGYITSVRQVPSQPGTFAVTTMEYELGKYFVEGVEYGMLQRHSGYFPIVRNSLIVGGRPQPATLHQLDLSYMLPGGRGKSYGVVPEEDRFNEVFKEAELLTREQAQTGIWEGAFVPQDGFRENGGVTTFMTASSEHVTYEGYQYIPIFHLNFLKPKSDGKSIGFPLPELPEKGKWMRMEATLEEMRVRDGNFTMVWGEKKKGRENRGSIYRDYRVLTYDLEGNLVNDVPWYQDHVVRLVRHETEPDLITGEDHGPIWKLYHTPIIGAPAHPNKLYQGIAAIDGAGNVRFTQDFQYGNPDKPLFSQRQPFYHQWYNGQALEHAFGGLEGGGGLITVIADEAGVDVQGISEEELNNRTTRTSDMAYLPNHNLPGSYEWLGRELLSDGSFVLWGLSGRTTTVTRGETQTDVTQSKGYIFYHYSATGELIQRYGIERGFSSARGTPITPEDNSTLWEKLPQGMEYLGWKDGKMVFCVWEPSSTAKSFPATMLSETSVEEGNFTWQAAPLNTKPVLVFVDLNEQTCGFEYALTPSNSLFHTSYHPSYWSIAPSEDGQLVTFMMVGKKINGDFRFPGPYHYFLETYER